MNTQCQPLRDQIAALLMGELDRQTQKELEDHLRSCPDCQAEQERLATTFQALGTIQDDPVPRPFFIEPTAQAPGIRQFLGSLPLRWKGAFSAAALVSAGLVIMALSGFQVRAEQGVLTLGFGDLPPSLQETTYQEERLRALTVAILERMDQRLEVERVALGESLQERFSQLNEENSEKAKQFTAALDEFENALRERRLEQDRQLLRNVQEFVLASYEQMRDQYRTDLAGVGEQLERFQLRDELQDQTMQVLSQAVSRIFEEGSGE